MSKRLVPASPFTCYIFHGFATRLSGCIANYISERFLACSVITYMDYQQDSVVGENPPSELSGQLPTGSGTDRVRLARCECVSLKLILYLRAVIGIL